MPINPKQERYLELFFPGLVAALRELGPGDFDALMPSLRPMGDGIRGIGLAAVYNLDDGDRVNIRMSLRLRDGVPPYVPGTPIDPALWERIHYAMGYGPSLDDRTIGIDLDDVSGHHVHLQGIHEHIRCDNVTPDVTNIDPRRFVDMVANYRTNGIYPVRMKP